MMSRRVDLVHSFLLLVSIATFWCVAYAQSDTDESCNTCPTKCIGRQVPRSWWTSMWGFIVTLVALTMDVWGVKKDIYRSTFAKGFSTFFLGACHPIYFLRFMLQDSLRGTAMATNLREACRDNIITPWYKSNIKIISCCKVVVNLSSEVHKESHNLNAFEKNVYTKDFSEALVIGHKVAGAEEFNVQLTPNGQLALLRSKVILEYDELKFLRGHTSLGMAIASAQAIGYIYGVVVRCVEGLRVSPIEAIAYVLNLVILMKGVVHNFTNVGFRPLLLYLLPTEEENFIEECKNVQDFEFKIQGKLSLAVSITCGVLLAVGAYFISNFLKSLNRICIVPIIIFEVVLVMEGLNGVFDNWVTFCLIYPIAFVNLVRYVWALVATFKYWKGEEFDVHSSNYLSQVLPHIG